MALIDLDAAGRRRALYATGASRWRRMAIVGAASAETPDEIATWDTLGALAETWEIPKFPLAGRDVLALGLAPGPRIGALLAEIEAEWIAGDFAADAAALKARLASRARESH